MKISFNWLKEYVAIRVSPQVFAEKLTMAGLEVAAVEKHNDDTVFDIEITANRADCLSVVGIAQEAAAVMRKPRKQPKKKRLVPAPSKNLLRLPQRFIRIHDTGACPFYRGCLLDNVSVGSSPAWLRERIEAMGVRSVNNVVDITNYCLLEFGQPLHAFDYEKISGGIVVRRAKKKEKILCLDGIERESAEDTLLISDEKRAVAIAGIMGGKLSEVGSLTKTVFLESACFDPVTIRRASRALGLSTESSYRFERGIDYQAVIAAQDKAAALLIEFCGARLVDMQTAGRLPQRKSPAIIFDCQKANELLSLDLSAQQIQKIFSYLGFGVKKQKGQKMRVGIPSFRRDIAVEEDLIEELGRIHGYDKVPSTMPSIRSQLITNDAAENLKQPIRHLLCALGFDEVITYSLVSKDMLPEGQATEAVRLSNPLSAEQEFLRPSLSESMLRCLAYNTNRGNRDLRFFELSHVFGTAKETLSLGMLATGNYVSGWQFNKAMDFFMVKGAAQTLLQRLGYEGFCCAPTDEPGGIFTHERVSLVCQEKTIGTMGRISQEVLRRLGIKHAPIVLYAELSLAELSQCRRAGRFFRPLPLFPFVSRDVSFLASETMRFEALRKVIEQSAGEILKDVRLVDLYRGEQIPAGSVSVTIALTFAREDRTLTDEEVALVMQNITEEAKRQLAVTVR